jgi:glutamyl/glutaminyl-tRNA synthetase
LTSESLYEYLLPFLKDANIVTDASKESKDWIGKTAKILSNYHQLLNEIAVAFEQFSVFTIDEEHMKFVHSTEAKEVIISFYNEIKELSSPISFDEVGKITKKIQTELEVKGKALYHPIRVAITGQDQGIELHDLIPIIENGSVLNISPKILNMKNRIEQLNL